MDIYLTELATGAKLALSMLPEQVQGSSSSGFRQYDVISVGEVMLPAGKKLLKFSFSGTLPGAGLKDQAYVKTEHWMEPEKWIGIVEGWRKNGKKLRLMVTETWMNHDVYLESFSAAAFGGNGSYSYDIALVEAKSLVVKTVQEHSRMGAGASPAQATPARPAAEPKKTYTVVKGDSLWRIAQKLLGKGSRYMEIYNLNKAVIGSDPNRCYPGWVLTIPS